MNGVHLHVSTLDFAVTAAYVLILNFLLRALAAKYADSAFGQALGSLI